MPMNACRVSTKTPEACKNAQNLTKKLEKASRVARSGVYTVNSLKTKNFLERIFGPYEMTLQNTPVYNLSSCKVTLSTMHYHY